MVKPPINVGVPMHGAMRCLTAGSRIQGTRQIGVILYAKGDLHGGPLLADDACDPELSGLEHALLFKKLPRPPRKSGGLFQTTGLLKEELLQLRHLGVIEGAQPQITGDGLLMLGDRRLSFAVEFDQPLHQDPTAPR